MYIAVPMIALERGIRAVSRMMNGIDLNRLVMISSVLYMYLFSSIPPVLVTVRMMPKINPITKTRAPAQSSMINVSIIA